CSHGAEHRLESATLAAGIESRNPATSGRAVVRVQCSLRLSWGSLQCPPRHGASAVFATIVVGKLAMSAAPRCECSVRYDCRRQPGMPSGAAGALQGSLRLSWGRLQCPQGHGASAVFATIVVGNLATSAHRGASAVFPTIIVGNLAMSAHRGASAVFLTIIV